MARKETIGRRPVLALRLACILVWAACALRFGLPPDGPRQDPPGAPQDEIPPALLQFTLDAWALASPLPAEEPLVLRLPDCARDLDWPTYLRFSGHLGKALSRESVAVLADAPPPQLEDAFAAGNHSRVWVVTPETEAVHPPPGYGMRRVGTRGAVLLSSIERSP